MRVLYCNKYNFPFSGAEVYLFEIMAMMRSYGHEVALFSVADARGKATPYDRHFMPHVDFKSKDSGPWRQVRSAARAIYSFEARRRLRDLVEEFKPDVAHVRNIYHHLSPSILWELKACGVPVVYHINDFKVLCPSYNMVAGGKTCQDCSGGQFWRILTKNCYTGPRGAAVVLAAEAYLHKWLDTYKTCVDRLLAPSQFVKETFIANGWDCHRIDVLPHSQQIPEEVPSPPRPNAPILYFGRLSAEKGVPDLLYVMKELPHVHLQIAGEGPQRAELERLAGELQLRNVEFLGQLQKAELGSVISSARFTVFPSRAYETFGKSILESFAHGRPVVASDLGSRRELVREGETGLLFQAGDIHELKRAIAFLAERTDFTAHMGRVAYKLARDNYSPESRCLALSRIYEQVASQARPEDARPATNNKTIRVAFIGGRGVISKYSGIETYYEEVGKRLVERGNEVTAYCRTYFTPSQEEHLGMQLVRLPTVRTKHLETLVHTFLSTVHAMFGCYDVVHYHALGPALFSFLPRLMGKKTVVTVQGLDWRRKKWGKMASSVLHFGEWAAIKFPNATIVVSETLRNHYLTEHHDKTIYVPNGTVIRERKLPVHLERWSLTPGEYVLFLGRFSPEKNCHLLIDAFEKLDSSVKLVLAGGSSHSSAYVGQLREHASERIIFLDWLSGDALDELLTHAMLFVLPSDLEGLSLALLDAMAAGVCVLTSDVPENRELVEDVGFTFRQGDSQDLERMLGFLVANGRAREICSRSALQRVQEHYLWARVAGEVEQIYRDLIRKTETWPVRGRSKRTSSRKRGTTRVA